MKASAKLTKKLTGLPLTPGVYLHKSAKGEIIYVGKAARLKNRVKHYFQSSSRFDTKTGLLIAEIVDTDWIETESEIDALFLEAELVKRYKPKFNIALRDDKSEMYVRLDIKSRFPHLNLVHQPLDDGAEYIGPFSGAYELKQALKLLRRIFPYDLRPAVGKKVSLDFHLGLSPGLEEGKTTLEEYRKNLKLLRLYLKGKRVSIAKELEKEMKRAAQAQQFERATTLRNQLLALKSLRTQVVFGDREFIDLTKDQALSELAELLKLNEPPHRIEGYDISHLSGTSNVASMVVFTNGLPDKAEYRKFKMTTGGNDDFKHLQEVISRRFSKLSKHAWAKPDLILIDGGKGQLSSVLEVLDNLNLQIPTIGLAKRFEQIIVKRVNDFAVINLPATSNTRKLLSRIRDEAHRFAVSYQTSITRSRATQSTLESVPGIGPATRKKLIRRFGSLAATRSASEKEISQEIGASKARLVRSFFKTLNKS